MQNMLNTIVIKNIIIPFFARGLRGFEIFFSPTEDTASSGCMSTAFLFLSAIADSNSNKMYGCLPIYITKY
jgi:hypothetical protein